jgi:predicted secreted Zn-dependent protease
VKRIAALALAIIVLLAVALWYLPTQPEPARQEARLPFADIPGVSMQYYDVAGDDMAAVRRSLKAVRPTDSHDGRRVDGTTQWAFRWRWHRDAQGMCQAAPEDVTFSAIVTIPRLAEADPTPELRAQFADFLRPLLAHEDEHVRYAWEHRGDIAKAINALDCRTVDVATVNAAAREVLKAISAQAIAYDKATDHGRKPAGR